MNDFIWGSQAGIREKNEFLLKKFRNRIKWSIRLVVLGIGWESMSVCFAVLDKNWGWAVFDALILAMFIILIFIGKMKIRQFEKYITVYEFPESMEN